MCDSEGQGGGGGYGSWDWKRVVRGAVETGRTLQGAAGWGMVRIMVELDLAVNGGELQNGTKG